MFTVPELSNEQVTLRPFGPEDAERVVEACNDPEIQRWLPLPNPYLPEHGKTWCGGMAEELRLAGDGLHLAFCGPGDQFAGSVSLKRTNWRARVCEVGYWTAPWMRRMGLTAEATRLLSTWALGHGMERVELFCAPGNIGSQRVSLAAGFEYEGRLKNAGFTHTGRTDLLVYSLTNPIEQPDRR